MFKLSNKHKYSLQRGLQLSLAPAYTLVSIFLEKNDNIVLTASLNNEFNDNSRALFEALYSSDEYKDRVFFVLNDYEKRKNLNQKYPNKFISNLKLSDVIFTLRAKYWVCSALELPVPGILQRLQRNVYHLGHGMLYKRIGLREKEVSWYKKLYYHVLTGNFSYTIATTEFFTKEVSQGFGIPIKRIMLLPQPKTAQVSNPKPVNNPILDNKNSTHILHAPTWRPYADVNLLPFEDADLTSLSNFLEENDIHLWLRFHPYFEQNIDVKLLSMKNIHLFSAKQYSEINQYLNYFDALITDYSSIYFDYLTLERPVLFFDYDFEEYNNKVGVIESYKDLKCTKTTHSQKQFLNQLKRIKDSSFALEGVVKANKLANFNISNHYISNYVTDKLFND